MDGKGRCFSYLSLPIWGGCNLKVSQDEQNKVASSPPQQQQINHGKGHYGEALLVFLGRASQPTVRRGGGVQRQLLGTAPSQSKQGQRHSIALLLGFGAFRVFELLSPCPPCIASCYMKSKVQTPWANVQPDARNHMMLSRMCVSIAASYGSCVGL